MSALPSFQQLARAARDRRLSHELETPIAELGRELDVSGKNRVALREAAARAGATTLGAFLDLGDAEQRLLVCSNAVSVWRIFDALKVWIGVDVDEDDDDDDGDHDVDIEAELDRTALRDAYVSPLVAATRAVMNRSPAERSAATGRPPMSADGLRTWAIQNRLDPRVLDLPAATAPNIAMLLNVIGRSGTSLTLRDMASNDGVSRRLQLSRAQLGFDGRFAALAGDFLALVARTSATLAARKRELDLRAEEPAEPALHALRARLQATRVGLTEGLTERPMGLAVPIETHFLPDPLRLRYREQELTEHSPRVVDILVEGSPSVSCTCGANPCAHRVAAVDAALDFLRDPLSRERGELAKELGTPSWERFFDLFDASIARRELTSAPEGERLVWRVTAHVDATLTVEAAVQKLGKSGRWSHGQRVSPADLWRHSALLRDPRDARVVDVYRHRELDPGFGGYGRHELWVQLARMLELLRTHPRVVAIGFDTPQLRIERGRLQIVVEPSSDRTDGSVTPSAPGLRIALAVNAAGVDLPVSARVLTTQLADAGDAVVVDRARGIIALVPIDEKALALIETLAKWSASFPPELHDELLRRLGLLQESAELVLPPSLVGEPIDGDARIVARIEPFANGADLDLLARPIERGPSFLPGEGAASVLHTRDGRRVTVRRALEEERRRATALAGSLPLAGADERGPWQYRVNGQDAMLDLVYALREHAGDEILVEWPKELFQVVGAATRGKLQLRIREGRDWFGLDGEVDVEGETIPLQALLDAVRGGRRYVAIGPRKFASIHETLRRRLEAAGDVIYSGRHGLEVAPTAATTIADLVDEPSRIEAAARWRALVGRIRAAGSMVDPDPPPELVPVMRPYQVEGFRWLSRLAAWGAGACLADDMGLGKTLQALAFILQRASLGPALVVAPTSVTDNWLREAARFAKSLRVRILRGPGRAAILGEARPGDLLVTSYTLATIDAEQLAGTRFATVVLDEAQSVKNAATRRARAIRSLDAEIKIALTGTPVENHLGELWSLMRSITPGLLGSWEQFRDRFVGPIERDHDAAKRAALARVVRPFLLRRTKAEVAPELPPRIEVERLVDLSIAERRLYDDARRAAAAAIAEMGSGGPEGRFHMLAAITRLRRLACNARLVDEDTAIPSSKLTALMELVRELREEGHRALVFSQFTTHLALVREALDREGMVYTYLDGSTPAADRSKQIDAFQAGKAELFLVSLKAGGTGLNLTAADYVIHLDPWWNPAVEDQATDRAHRIGQTKAVTVIRLISRGTIEEAVLALHGEKRALAAGVFDEEGGAARLSTDDLAALIRAGSETTAGDAEEDAARDAGDEAVGVEDSAPISERPVRAKGKKRGAR